MLVLNFKKSISFVVTGLGLLALNNLVLIDSVSAFSVTFNNGGFEDDITNSQNSWNTIGDVTISPTIDGVDPTNGLTQAIITTGYRQTTDSSGTSRNDDNGLIFNNSANEPVNADTNGSAALQNHFNFSSNAFSIDRSAGAKFPGTRVSKEGSGMYQDFSVTLNPGETGFKVAFDWAYLSNDGTTGSGGEQDFAFWNIGRINGNDYTTDFSNTDNPEDEIMVLLSSSSNSNIEDAAPPTTVDDYLYEYDYNTNGQKTYVVDGLTEGQTYNYRLGYGVVDVDGLERTSTLLVDNILIEEVPFEFSPTLGLLFVGSVFGFKTAWGKNRNAKNLQIDRPNSNYITDVTH